MNLGCGLDEVLEVCSQKEVTQVNELAVALVLDVDNAPPVLATADLLTVNNDRLLGSDDGEGDQVLWRCVSTCKSNLSWANVC